MEERCVREILFKYDDSNKSCKWKNAVEERFLYNSLDNFKQKSQKELSWLLMFKSTSRERLKWFNNSHLWKQLLKDKLRETKLTFNKMHREARTIHFNSDNINDCLVSINQSI